MVAALREAGCAVETPGAGFYLWAATPQGEPGVSFARRLLLGPALVVMPGEWLAEPLRSGVQPGAGRVRLALVPSLDRCHAAAARLSDWS
jgi:N-succinyldiaminopimelate aminotransferase